MAGMPSRIPIAAVSVRVPVEADAHVVADVEARALREVEGRIERGAVRAHGAFEEAGHVRDRRADAARAGKGAGQIPGGALGGLGGEEVVSLKLVLTGPEFI